MATTARFVRGAAHILGVAAAALWAVPLVAGIAIDRGIDSDAIAESVAIAVLAVANITGVVVSFLRDRLGARWLVISGTGFCAFALLTAGRNHALAVAVSGGPFLVSGLLALLAHRMDTIPSSSGST